MTWIDTLPAIPLARAVPVVSTAHRIHIELFGREDAVVVSATVDGVILADAHAVDAAPCSLNSWRPDLDDPQGFGYALRYACQHCDPSISYLWPAMSSRWIRGETTDTDRLALAQAIADVVGGGS